MMRGGVLLIIMAMLTSHVMGQLQFTVTPTNVTVEDGMELTLPCVATGASNIFYLWHRDNLTNPLANSSDRVYYTDGNLTGGNLTFNEVIVEDEDVYFCMAIDRDDGSNRVTSDPVYLTVTMVTITSLTVSSSATKRNNTVVWLDCVAVGDTDGITYNWYKDDDILINDHRISVLDNGSLLINVTDYRLDNGEYYCEAIDRYGNNVTSSNSAILSIAYLEENFVTSPSNVTVNSSDSNKTRIYCTAPEGYPAATLSWRRLLTNDTIVTIVPVVQDDRIKIRRQWLTINAPQANDTGFYQCVANNSYYERTSHFVYLKFALAIPCEVLVDIDTARPPVYGLIGKPVFLHCIPPGSQDFMFSWKRSSRFIDDNILSNGTLAIYNYTEHGNGLYSCLVTNECNTNVVVANINLITAEINNITISQGPVVIGVGRSFQLDCPPPEAKPEANVTWIFNNVTIATSGRYTKSSATLSDNGTYTCRAENVAGYKESIISVTILEKPVVTINSVVVQLGSTVELKCSSSSDNVTGFQWSYNGTKLEGDGDKVKITYNDSSSTLSITNVGEEDFGVYNCTVMDNVHLPVTVFGYVNHTDKIYFTHDSNMTEAEVGTTAQFVCSVAGAVGNVIFTWYEKARELNNDSKYNINYMEDGLIHTSQLNLMVVGDNVQYTYHCSVTDMSSSARTTFTLYTTLRPFFRSKPENITVVPLGGTVTIHCGIGGRPTPQVTWVYGDLTVVRNDSSRMSFPNGTLLIRHVVEEDYGEYICHATEDLDVSHEIKLVQPTGSKEKKIAGLSQEVFLIVIGVVIVVIIYTAIMCLMLILCCYCHKQDKNAPPYRQERNLYTPDPPGKEERGSSVVSRTSNGVKEVPGMTYYDLPHPFSRASSDARSHDTMELIRMADQETINNTASRSSQMTESMDHHDNQFRYSDSPTFPRTNLQFTNKLGDGEFGPVYQGIAKELLPGEPDTLVAIKMLLHPRDGDEESSSTVQDLDNFRAQMKLQYTNIASILAMCTDIRPYYIVYEYLDCGDLKKFLRNSSPEGDQPPKLTQHGLLQIILQVADGMSYLSSNKIIHGDLAARNCIISSELRVKVADLGIGHDVYNDDYYDDGAQLLPIRWMPPEILQTAEFSIYSDMWSFGVLCWEVFSFGRQPYEMVSNEELLTLIPAGLQLEIPEEGCPNPLYAIMQECWHLHPENRPKFAHLCVAIIDLDLD